MNKGTVAVLSAVMGAAAGAVGANYFGQKEIAKNKGKVDKFKGYYNLLNQWLLLKQEGKSLEKYFIDNGYKTVAIYGMGEMGNRLYDELKNSTEVEIKYAVDKNAESTYAEIDVVDKDGEFEDVDVIVVTATFAFDEILEELNNKVDFPVVSLEDVVFEI